MEDDGSFSVFSTSNLHHHQQQSLIFQQNSGHIFHQHNHHLPPFPQQPHLAVNFKPREESTLNHHQHDAAFLHGNHQHFSQNPQEDSPIKEPFWKPLHRTERSKDLDNKHRFFGELEAIYGANSPANVAFNEFQGHNAGVDGVSDDVPSRVDHGPETPIGEQASSLKIEKQKIKKKMKDQQLCSMLVCFENLVKQVTLHQEELHKRLWEVFERMDKERSAKEESWRQQEVKKREAEAIARANERALASSRETLIVSYLEKITGQSIDLDNNSRWPRAEVEALIRGRRSFESKFREPGSKGPLWEEVSSLMASLGYQRSAKRCKEKWENMNKHSRKSKENRKHNSQNSGTCTYFGQLDKLYSSI